MNRLWLGIGLLVLILAGGIFAAGETEDVYGEIAGILEEAAREEDFEKAVALADSAAARWDAYRNLLAAVSDHRPMEEMDRQFAAMRVYGIREEAAEFYASCALLAVSARAMGEAHTVTWWNLL